MTKKLIISTVWGVAFWLVSAFATVDYTENYYAARVARGADPAFGDIGSTWLIATIGVGLLFFTLGILGVLPGTKQSRD